MTEDTPPVAVETMQQKPKSRKKILVIGAVLIVILILLNFKSGKIFGLGDYHISKIFGTNDSEKNFQEIIEIDKVRILSTMIPAEERYVDVNLTLYNVTRGNATTIMVSSNESLETWKDIVEFYEGVESTEFKFVYSAKYRYRKYYFWWHNDTLLALDTTDMDKNLINTVIGDLPPTEDLF